MDTPHLHRTDVLVVGAGPSGLMAGVVLARLGVAVTVIDGKDGPTQESRALALQARSMEIYDQLGLVERVLAECDPAPRVVPGFRTRTFDPISFTGFGGTLTPYPGIYILEQSKNETLLRDEFLRLGGDLRWRHQLRDLRIDPAADDPVEALIDTPAGPTTIRATWCIGADGATSQVRRLRDIAFEGSTNPLRFFVADALDATGLVEHAVNMRVSRDDFALTFPMGAPGHHRILGVADDVDDDEALEAQVKVHLAAEFAVRYTRASWFASYRVHHRLAARFRDGPVFLVGDAAHVHSPVGAQGMNTGLQDAHNLACKLADVIHGRIEPDFLDRYEAERRPVAHRLVSTTDAAFARITSRGRFARFVRDRVVPRVAPVAVRVVPRLVGTERAFGYLAQVRVHYWLSDDDRAARHGHRHPVVGRRLPWTGGNYDVLRAFTWQLHGYGVEAGQVAEAAEMLGIEGHVFRADPHHRLAASRLYLVRPDGFVAAALPV
ncbi:FAD-dependent monooxygenase [Propionibacteriaceae bacterium G57]|uniref:FAD-dependent monooxygenase n=1 Tax=Aestuariimicrobium sp. G57 TaxID=3418485 RepID=UPI003DA78118